MQKWICHWINDWNFNRALLNTYTLLDGSFIDTTVPEENKLFMNLIC